MSTVRKCDGCGKLSPDENGLYIANHWLKIQAYRGTMVREYEFCNECIPRDSHAVTELPKQLLDLLKRVF